MPASGAIKLKAFRKLKDGPAFPADLYRIEHRKRNAEGVSTGSTWQNTPLHLSCADGEVSLLKSILQQIANGINKLHVDKQDYNGKTPLHHAITATNNAIEIVRVLLEEGAVYDIRDNDNEFPMDIANRIGRFDIRTIIEEEHTRRHTNPGYKRPRLEDYQIVPSLEVSVDNNDEEEDDEDSESSDDDDEV